MEKKMEEVLLSKAVGGGDSSPRWLCRKGANRRSDAIVYGSPCQKAAALVDLAEDGFGMDEEILERSSFSSSVKLYVIFAKLNFLWSLNYFALIVLNFLEKPLWCSKELLHSCSDREYYFLGELMYLTGTESLVYEVVTLVVLMTHVLYPISYEGFHIYWKSVLNRMKVILLLVLNADLLTYVLSLAGLYHLPFRVAPYLRVAFFILYVRELRDSFCILAGMSRTYLNVMVLSLLFLLFSSWIGYVFFEDTLQGKTVFTSYGKTLYQMFILFTTSNNPDVWIAAYKDSRWYCLFFVLYVLLGVYFVTNLILAVVFDSFKSELAKQVAEKDCVRLRILKKAFSLLDKQNCGFLNKDQCIHFFEELKEYRGTLPNISSEDFELIFDELDDKHDFKVDLDEFFDLTEAIALKFQKEDSLPCFERFPNIYHSPASEKLRDFVRSPKFEYIIVFILVINFIAIVIQTTHDMDISMLTFWRNVESIFGWLYVIEMALKIYTYGFENYWRKGQNRFDFIITWIIVIGETTANGLTFLSNGKWIRYLLIARMLRLIRLLLQVRSYRAFVATFLNLIPNLMPYLGTVFCILCIYCSLGLQIFGGIVNAGNPKLDETDLADNDYLLFNFNDYPNGMVTLFNLLVMGNWQVWMQSYKDLTGTWWTCAYFISFYVISVLWLLNLVVAFVLEVFQAEIELETLSTLEDGKGKEETGKRRPRIVGAKTRSQRVDSLLRHMLSSELTELQPRVLSTLLPASSSSQDYKTKKPISVSTGKVHLH